MELIIGQKVSYPNQGVCEVEGVEQKKIGDCLMSFYLLRILSDDSTIFVPVENANSVGIRPVINPKQYKNLINGLSEDFGEVSNDWKTRSREYSEKLQSGDVFKAADVLKKLTFLSHEKKLSFREQTLLEKARFLIVSEVTNAGLASENKIENKINQLVENACAKHHTTQPSVMAAHL
ncbi:MAG: CarD family transcriptional regulator [Acidobacteriota bacterium]|nr:CarD family transcriptional regulator [Acidobacteriota bacterium]